MYQHDLFWLLLGAISFLTGFVAAIGGAGGLIIMPFMIGAGIPPQVAVATAKFSSFGLWAIVLAKFNKAKLIAWRYVIPMSVLAAIGGVMGARVALSIDTDHMIFAIGFLFLLIGIISLINPHYGLEEKRVSKPKTAIGFFLYFVVISISGLFPGGMSIFIIFTFVTFFGLNTIQAHATDIFPWVVQTIASTIVYLMHDMVNFNFALSIFIGMALGGHFGAKLAVAKGAKLVKYVISILAVLIGLYWTCLYGSKLFFDKSLAISFLNQ